VAMIWRGDARRCLGFGSTSRTASSPTRALRPQLAGVANIGLGPDGERASAIGLELNSLALLEMLRHLQTAGNFRETLKGHPTVDRQAGARHVAGLSTRQDSEQDLGRFALQRTIHMMTGIISGSRDRRRVPHDTGVRSRNHTRSRNGS